jgi:hypothetical protein
LERSRDYSQYDKTEEVEDIKKIRDEKGDITTNTNKIQKTISILKTYSSKLETLDEVDKFLDACNQLKLNQEDINYINSPIICNEIETVIDYERLLFG